MMCPSAGRPTFVLIAIAVLVAVTLCQTLCVAQAPPPRANAELPGTQGATITTEGRNPKTAFESYYEPVQAAAAPNLPGYLPLDLEQIANLETFPPAWRSEAADEVLARQGFVVTDAGPLEDIIKICSNARNAAVPVFVTTDILLHLYHLQFDVTLKNIEEREFHPQMIEFSRAMLALSQQQYQALEGLPKEAARRNAAFFAVGLGCLQGGAAPDLVVEEVQAELKLIEDHAGWSESPIFVYKEDYSQYVPRGHYTQSETLKKYFKGLMWYGRISMLLKGESLDGLISDENANIQTLQASLIAGSLHDPGNARLLEIWNRLYGVTSFYVGLADDLTPQEYAGAVAKVAGAALAWSALGNDEVLYNLRSELATYRSPQIYGGTGQIVLYPPFSPEQLKELLDDTKGMRLMGQRFVPDAYMMQSLIFPKPGAFTGTGKPFTLEYTGGGPQRVFARGLDVMAVLGSQRAYDILKAEGDTAYAEYDQRLAEMREEFGAMSPAEWNRNLYCAWLYALQALLVAPGGGYQAFMQTPAYVDRCMWAALASWAELKHDTILYAKQPYAPVGAGMPPSAELPGYVEPLPDFYARMLALARMTRAGLADMQVLDEQGLQRLNALEEIIGNLLRISQLELRGEELSEQDVSYIKHIDGGLKRCIEGMTSNEEKTSIVADVLTDTNTNQCLEEGVGYVKRMLVAYRVPDGRIALGVGPVLSYYEFKHPIDDRLTDEAWRERLQGDAPDAPAWTGSFYVAEG